MKQAKLFTSYLKSEPEHGVVVIEVGDGEDDNGHDPDNHRGYTVNTYLNLQNSFEIATGTVVDF